MSVETLTESEFVVKKIPLTQGKFSIVDAVDFDFLCKWKWHAVEVKSAHTSVWYARRTTGDRRNLYMHTAIALSSGWGNGECDHKDGDGLNNQRNNIRHCNHSQNNGNRKKQLGTTSSYKGVSWCKSRNSWEANINIFGKKRFLGRYKSEIEAAIAYDQAAKKYFREFARLNFQ